MGARITKSYGLSSFICLVAMLGAIPTLGQPALVIRTPSNAVELRFQGISGTTNQVQWVGSIGATNWTTLTNIALSSNQVITVLHKSVTNLSQRFYRLAISGMTPSNPHPDELVWIPAGTFLLGSSSNEVDRRSREGPQTQVTLTRGFWMGVHEVTQFEYGAVMNSYPSRYQGFYLPVDTVTWYDATNYCSQRTTQERAAGTIPDGYAYRLPTESEWEYACRAGTSTRFSYGDDSDYSLLINYAWYGESGIGPNHYIQQKLPNAWGLYDMYGNVYEWCLDWYVLGGYPGGSLTDPKGPVTGTQRVLRSGSTASLSRDCRSAYRDYFEPNVAFSNAGLRVVLAPIVP